MKFAQQGLLATAAALALASVLGAPAANASTVDVADLWASADASSVAMTSQNEAIAVAAWKEVSTSSDPASALASLSPTRLADLKAYVTPTSSVYVPSSTSPEPALTARSAVTAPGATASSCYSANGYFYEVNGFGGALWNFKTTGGWCSNGTSVTSSSYIGSYASVSWAGWFYKGVTGHSTGVVGGSGRTYSQGKFQFIVAGVVVQEVLPCNRVVGFANGSWVADNTCGLS
jgi:hypothetical protein